MKTKDSSSPTLVAKIFQGQVYSKPEHHPKMRFLHWFHSWKLHHDQEYMVTWCVSWSPLHSVCKECGRIPGQGWQGHPDHLHCPPLLLITRRSFTDCVRKDIVCMHHEDHEFQHCWDNFMYNQRELLTIGMNCSHIKYCCASHWGRFSDGSRHIH
ncbi:DNA dC-_dU-editing enzyme APOBEC-3G [Plecturocebus cupreus]